MRFFLFLILTLQTLTSWSQIPPTQTPEYWQAKAIKEPQNALYYFNLGVVYQKQNDFDNALINYDKVISLKSKLSPVALFYKAQLFENIGKLDLTKEALSAIKMDEVPEKTRATILAYKNKIFATDFKNSAEGFGGAITAALFLQKFVRGKKWAHLDIYAWADKASGAINASGGNGQSVQCLIDFLSQRELSQS